MLDENRKIYMYIRRQIDELRRNVKELEKEQCELIAGHFIADILQSKSQSGKR